MQIGTLLNYVEKIKSFVYRDVKLVDAFPEPRLEVRIEARANGRPVCSGRGRAGPGYDRLAEREFEYVPLWGIPVVFKCRPRRVECSRCGVRVEALPLELRWAG